MQHWNGATLAHSIAEVSITNTLEIGFFEVFPNQPMILVCCAGQDASISIKAGHYLGYEYGKQC